MNRAAAVGAVVVGDVAAVADVREDRQYKLRPRRRMPGRSSPMPSRNGCHWRELRRACNRITLVGRSRSMCRLNPARQNQAWTALAVAARVGGVDGMTIGAMVVAATIPVGADVATLYR